MSWNAKNFRKGFDHLQVPITTATERQISDWKGEDVWEAYWASIRDFCDQDERCQELISIIMSRKLRAGTTLAHRRAVELWVMKHIPGYRILWEADILPQLNHLLKVERGLPTDAPDQLVTGFQYGKDGRGALPDQHYQTLLENRFLTVGNHHDILGHLILFTIPEIRETTERVVAASTKVLKLQDHLQAYHDQMPRGPARTAFERRYLHAFRPLRSLVTYSWNLAQEKLYFSMKGEKRPSFALLGAFNTVYNTTLSAKLSVEHIDSTTAGLGLFSAEFRRTIVMAPETMRRYILPPVHLNQPSSVLEARSALSDAIQAYADSLNHIGLHDFTEAQAGALATDFKEIVRESIFAAIGPFRLPMRMRWKKYGRLIQAHPVFSQVFERSAMLKIADGQALIADAAVRLQQCLFEANFPVVTEPRQAQS